VVALTFAGDEAQLVCDLSTKYRIFQPTWVWFRAAAVRNLNKTLKWNEMF
jgi:hypothetical protein